MRCPSGVEVNAQTIHEAAAPLASLLEVKSPQPPCGCLNSHHSRALRYKRAQQLLQVLIMCKLWTLSKFVSCHLLQYSLCISTCPMVNEAASLETQQIHD